MPDSIRPVTALWRVPGDPAAVFDLLVRVEDWPLWWASVHERAVAVMAPPLPGRPEAVELVSHGRTPLRLRWTVALLSARRPEACAFRAEGDVAGDVECRLGSEGPYVLVESTWRVRARGLVRRALAQLLAPMVRAEARWALHQGELGARLDARRRLAVTPHERASIPYLRPPAWVRPGRASAPGVPAPTTPRA